MPERPPFHAIQRTGAAMMYMPNALICLRIMAYDFAVFGCWVDAGCPARHHCAAARLWWASAQPLSPSPLQGQQPSRLTLLSPYGRPCPCRCVVPLVAALCAKDWRPVGCRRLEHHRAMATGNSRCGDGWIEAVFLLGSLLYQAGVLLQGQRVSDLEHIRCRLDCGDVVIPHRWHAPP